MNYEMYRIHHSRGKSDTNFYQEKKILNGAYSSLKVLRVSVVNDLEKSKRNVIKKAKTRLSKQYNQNKFNIIKSQLIRENNTNIAEGILTLIERILLFKQEFDLYFFENNLKCLKFHLNNISTIKMSIINEYQKQLISECPYLQNSLLIRYLQNFSDVIKVLIETKPEDFYKEIKDAILNQWEINRIRIKELFDKIEIKCNNCVSKDSNDFDLSIIGDEFLKTKKDIYNNDENKKLEDEESNNRLKKCAPYVLKYLLSKKKEIKKFITMMTQGILFTISQLYYNMDYYSIIISSLAFKVFYGIMYYIDENKDKNECLNDIEKSRKNKVYHIISHFINLALKFNQNIQAGIISLDNGGLNSISKFILNNFIELIPKCQGIIVPKIFPKYENSTLFQTTFRSKFYKCYLQRYKKYHDNSLLRIFMLYYNSKITFWKSVMIEAKSKDDNKYFTCRTCEKEIPLEDIFLHLGCCKEQQSFYDRMKGFKVKLEHYITSLIFYLEKLKLGAINDDKNIFKLLTNILVKDDNNNDNGVNLLKNLIKLYSYEKSKDNDYYEERPEEINYVISMSYFSLFIYLINKVFNDTDPEISEIFGGIFCTLLQIMINVYFLLYIKKSKAKSSIVKGRQNLFERKKGRVSTVKQVNYEEKFINLLNDNNRKNMEKEKEKKGKNNESSKEDNNNMYHDILSSEFNFKNEIQKYKSKLSLNNSMLANNSMHSNSFRKRVNSFHKSSKHLMNTSIVNRLNKINSSYNIEKKRSFNDNTIINRLNKDNNFVTNKKYKKSKSKLDSKDIQFLKFLNSKKDIIENNNNIINNNKNIRRNKSSGNIFFDSNLNEEKSKSPIKKKIKCLNKISDKNINESEILKKMEYLVTNSIYPEKDYINNTKKKKANKDNSAKNSKLSLFGSSPKSNKKESTKKINNISLYNKNSLSKNSNKNSNSNIINDIDEEVDCHSNSSLLNGSIEIENGEKDKAIIDFEKTEESFSYDENSDNIIIGEKEYEDDLSINLYIDPETRKNMNEEQIPNLYNELLQGIDKNFEQNFAISVTLHNTLFPKLSAEKGEIDIIYNKKRRVDSPEVSCFYNTSHFNKTKNYINNNMNNINIIKKEQDIDDEKYEINEKTKEDDNPGNKSQRNIVKTSKFKLILPIAKGGYGSVGLYKKITTSDTYAIKTVDINSMKEKKLSSSLKNEQNILKEINNDYVVNSYYLFQDKKNYYFVMDYLPGGDVYTLLSKNTLPKKTIQLIVAETILAVNYLHSIHIIHHDIKPENILISLKGHFKLSDFGLSKTLSENGKIEVEETHVKNMIDFVEFKKFPSTFEDEDENKEAVGTLNYMSPELFTDKYPHGSGIDYWAIGVLIFDLYSYSLPFEGKTQEETRNNIIGIKMDWDKLINDNIKKVYGNIDSAIDLIKKFIKENPAERWGDHNLDEIKKHPFFEGFNWDDVQNIKNDTIKEYVKQRVKENNNKIKQINMKNKEKKEKGEKNENDKMLEGYPAVIEINLTENEEKYFFTERLDNLNKKNKEIIKKKITKKDNINGNLSNLMLIDLE